MPIYEPGLEEILKRNYKQKRLIFTNNLREAVENSDLLDKKVVKRSTEATLVLEKDMTLEDELVEYLTYILELPEDKIFDILGTYNDYAQATQLG